MSLIGWYEEFKTKWGFDDGDNTPGNADIVRAWIIIALNAVLQLSPVEAYAFDRCGIHNSYLILWRDKGSEEEQQKPEPENVDDLLDTLDEELCNGCGFPIIA